MKQKSNHHLQLDDLTIPERRKTREVSRLETVIGKFKRDTTVLKKGCCV